MKSLHFNVFGRRVLVTGSKNSWTAFYPGEGTKIPANDIKLPPDILESEIDQWLDDICHEWATARHPKVERLDQSMSLSFRDAIESDLPFLISMLADDALGALREDPSNPLDESYLSAFKNIESDPNNELVVVECENTLVGMLQLTFIPYLSHRGSWRCLIESVRIQSQFRGMGLGTEFFEWAIKNARQKNCSLVQLTSDKKRPGAIRFYENLGFQATHEGFKLKL